MVLTDPLVSPTKSTVLLKKLDFAVPWINSSPKCSEVRGVGGGDLTGTIDEALNLFLFSADFVCWGFYQSRHHVLSHGEGKDLIFSMSSRA